MYHEKNLKHHGKFVVSTQQKFVETSREKFVKTSWQNYLAKHHGKDFCGESKFYGGNKFGRLSLVFCGN